MLSLVREWSVLVVVVAAGSGTAMSVVRYEVPDAVAVSGSTEDMSIMVWYELADKLAVSGSGSMEGMSTMVWCEAPDEVAVFMSDSVDEMAWDALEA